MSVEMCLFLWHMSVYCCGAKHWKVDGTKIMTGKITLFVSLHVIDFKIVLKTTLNNAKQIHEPPKPIKTMTRLVKDQSLPTTCPTQTDNTQTHTSWLHNRVNKNENGVPLIKKKSHRTIPFWQTVSFTLAISTAVRRHHLWAYINKTPTSPLHYDTFPQGEK